MINNFAQVLECLLKLALSLLATLASGCWRGLPILCSQVAKAAGDTGRLVIHDTVLRAMTFAKEVDESWLVKESLEQ